MKLLIITQKVNKSDPILGFFHRWIEEFSKYCEKVVVICLEKGDYSLAPNVKVLSLGKESRLSRLKYLLNFYKFLWQERGNYDVVFVHMNPVYIVLAGWFWKIYQKSIALWYTHSHVDWKLQIAEKFSNLIFSASKESFRLKSGKLIITGHGIDTEIYRPAEIKKDKQIILSVGRLSRTKNHHLAIEAFSRLLENKSPRELWLVGEAIYKADLVYKQELIDLIESRNLINKVRLLGMVTPDKMPAIYQQADLLVNLSDTGSLDKVVLEAMASGVRVVSSNEAYYRILPEKNLCSKRPEEISRAIEGALTEPSPQYLRDYVVENHNLTSLIVSLIKHFSTLK